MLGFKVRSCNQWNSVALVAHAACGVFLVVMLCVGVWQVAWRRLSQVCCLPKDDCGKTRKEGRCSWRIPFLANVAGMSSLSQLWIPSVTTLAFCCNAHNSRPACMLFDQHVHMCCQKKTCVPIQMLNNAITNFHGHYIQPWLHAVLVVQHVVIYMLPYISLLAFWVRMLLTSLCWNSLHCMLSMAKDICKKG